MDYTQFLSDRALRRRTPAIRKLYPLLKTPGIISLGGGNPSPTLFPFKNAVFTLVDGSEVSVSAATFEHSLQYNDTEGLPELVARLRNLQIAEHNLKHTDFSLITTPGSQDGITKIFDALLNDEDTLIVEAPTYAGALSFLEVIGTKFLQVRIDGEGMIPELLDEALLGWNTSHPGERKPKLLYLIPSGSNPAGTTMGEARRRSIYAVAQRYNLLILEDDPYYFLQFGESKLPPSFLSLDADGRVIRTDSVSKILSAGIRMGFTTGPKPILDRIIMASQSTMICPSGMSGVAVLALLQHWHVGDTIDVGFGTGRGRMSDHLTKVHDFYRAQCASFVAAARKKLRCRVLKPQQQQQESETPTFKDDEVGDPLVSFRVPTAGMFCWLELHGVPDSFALITERAVEKKASAAL